MYPFLEQLIKSNNPNLGMLILDVKGNFFKKVLKYSYDYNRTEDIIIISLDSHVRYNPLHKPDLNPSVLANRLKIILELFSPQTSESYWLDKVQDILTECIKLCRLYNNGYVTFTEIHNLINYNDYYKSKIDNLRNLFMSGKLSHEDIYNLHSSLSFFENEFTNLDERTKSILKSEITRITGIFVSDFRISKTFCPSKNELTFENFKEVNLFLRGIIPMIGFKTDIVEYERSERFAGESKYPLKKMISFAIDGITSLSVKPIRFITSFGIGMFLISILLLVYFLTQHLLGNTIQGWTTLAISVWAIGGLQLLAIGIVGEYIGKIYLETKKRPRFIVDKFIKK